jgi:hypothetical protein
MFVELLGLFVDWLEEAGEVVENVDTQGVGDSGIAANAGSHVGAPQFSGDVEFPDGSTVTDPYRDHTGYVYPNRESYISGTNKHELSG